MTAYDIPMPRVLRYLIYATVGVAVFAALTDPLARWLGLPSLQYLLSLSWRGFSSGFLWQPITYLFVYQGGGGFSFWTLIALAFHMYILYMTGTAILAYTKENGLLKLYFGAGLTAGLVGVALMFLGVPGLLYGAGPAVYAILMVWGMAYPGLSLMLFMMVPILARWVVALFLGIHLLLTLSNGDLVGGLTYLAGAGFGYGYGVIACNFSGPWPALWGIDRFLRRFQGSTSVFTNAYEKAKVYDFQTGEAIVNDEDFMDAMLEKIAKNGEGALTRKERRRMEEISKNRGPKRR